MQALWQNFKNLLTTPLAEELDTVHLFLIVGVVLVSIAAWIIILGYIKSGVSTVGEQI